MPRKPIDIRPPDDPVTAEKGHLHPFPALRRGRVRAEPAYGSRDWSLVGVGATPQGLKITNICYFQGSLGPFLFDLFFHKLLDTTFFIFHCCFHFQERLFCSRLARESWREIRVCISRHLLIRISAHSRGAYIRWGSPLPSDIGLYHGR